MRCDCFEAIGRTRTNSDKKWFGFANVFLWAVGCDGPTLAIAFEWMCSILSPVLVGVFPLDVQLGLVDRANMISLEASSTKVVLMELSPVPSSWRLPKMVTSNVGWSLRSSLTICFRIVQIHQRLWCTLSPDGRAAGGRYRHTDTLLNEAYDIDCCSALHLTRTDQPQ